MKGNRMVSSLKRQVTTANLGIKLSKHTKYSTAFDPFWQLHQSTVTRDQQEAFRKVWENDIGDFKKDLTKEEFDKLQRKVNETASLDEFETLMKGLWGPDRHSWIRETATFKYVNERVLNGIKKSSNPRETGCDLIFGDNDKFNKFLLTSSLQANDTEGYLNDLIYADLRYLCAAIAFDYFDGPKITIAFGHRRQYHYNLPNPKGGSAHWMNCIYDRVEHSFYLVYLCAAQALKEGKPISPKYFKEQLDSLEHNALKEEEWRHYAEQLVNWDLNTFYDDFDRSFNHFQMDPDVTKLKIRFATDWERFKV